MISSIFLNKIAEFIKSKINNVEYTIDGITNSITYSSLIVTDNTVKVTITLDENIEGTITQFKIIDTDSDVIKTEDCNIIKSTGKGLYKSFTLDISEVVTNE